MGTYMMGKTPTHCTSSCPTSLPPQPPLLLEVQLERSPFYFLKMDPWSFNSCFSGPCRLFLPVRNEPRAAHVAADATLQLSWVQVHLSWVQSTNSIVLYYSQAQMTLSGEVYQGSCVGHNKRTADWVVTKIEDKHNPRPWSCGINRVGVIARIYTTGILQQPHQQAHVLGSHKAR